MCYVSELKVSRAINCNVIISMMTPNNLIQKFRNTVKPMGIQKWFMMWSRDLVHTILLNILSSALNANFYEFINYLHRFNLLESV